jgi:ribonuclease Z
MTVTLLGTGSPSPNPVRFSAATLVQAGGLNMLFDAGRGCTIRLRQLGVRLGSVSPVFLTHFHSDHTVGLPDIWMTGYIQTA